MAESCSLFIYMGGGWRYSKLSSEKLKTQNFLNDPSCLFVLLGKVRTQSRATEPRHRVQGRGQEEQEEDKAQPQSPATEPSHGAQPQSSGARPVSVASSFLSKIEPQQ